MLGAFDIGNGPSDSTALIFVDMVSPPHPFVVGDVGDPLLLSCEAIFDLLGEKQNLHHNKTHFPPDWERL